MDGTPIIHPRSSPPTVSLHLFLSPLPLFLFCYFFRERCFLTILLVGKIIMPLSGYQILLQKVAGGNQRGGALPMSTLTLALCLHEDASPKIHQEDGPKPSLHTG